jgi:hypothetical protein
VKKIGLAIAELHRSETELARDLESLAARHHGDQDVCHLARDLSRWCDDHVAALADHGRRHGRRLSARRRPALGRTLQKRVSDLVRSRPEPALLLLADLRRVHRVAAGASLDWELLAQAAQAAKDADLQAMCARCHPQTLRQMRWANAMLKELSPQALTN